MRVCSGAGCLRAVPDDVRFCDECKPVPSAVDDGIRENQRTDGYNADLDALRKSGRWQRLRSRVVREEPMCQRCSCEVTEIVDHVVPAQEAIRQAIASALYRMDKWAGYFFRSNLQGLCRKCHALKTTEDKAHQGEWPDVVAREARAPKRHWSF